VATLLNTPSLGVVVVAKVMFAFAWGLAFGALMALGAGGTAWMVASANAPATLALVHGQVLGILARTVACCGLWSVFGIGLALLARSQIIGVTLGLVYTVVLEPPLVTIAGENASVAGLGKFLPGSASLSLVWPPPAGNGADDAVRALGSTGGGLVLAAYAAVLVGVGYVVRRRDVVI